MSHEIFVPLVGQYDNIGDILLRRPLMRWLRPHGKLHVYVGPAPAGYTRALDVQPGDVVYESFGAWYAAGLKAAVRGHASYFFKPGEIQLTAIGMKEHLSVLPLITLIRLRGGAVVRVGSGARNLAPLARVLMAPSLALCQYTRWRDTRTAAYLGHGGVMPDLAFGDGDQSPSREDRDVMVVSMRGDRGPVPGQWIEAVRASADRLGLQIWIVTQVHRDAKRSSELARALNANVLGWDGIDHASQEVELRQLYRRARLAVSDRLHVLIAAYTHGVVPVGLLTDGSDKVARHFQAAGLDKVVLHTAGMSAEAIISGIAEIAERRHQILSVLPAARDALETVRSEATAWIPGAARRPSLT